MAYLEVSAFKKIRAFFWALQKSSFNLNKIPFRDNEGTPVDKAYCLNLLRSFSDFQGEEFEDDNFLIKYLSKPGNLKQILDQFTPAQQIELTKALEEKPTAVEVRGEQPSGGETSAEQGVPAQTPVGEAAGAMGMPGLPSTPSISTPRMTRIIHNIPQTPEPETTTSSSSQATVKTTTTTPAPSAKSGSATVTSSKGFTPTDSTSASSSTTSATGSADIETKTQIHAPKPLATTGPPVDDISKEATQPARGIRGGGTRFQAPRIPYAATNAAKNFGSSAQIGIKKASTRLGSAFSNFLGGVGRTGGGMLGGGIGVGGRALGRVSLRAFDFGANLSSAVSTRGSAFATAGRGGARFAMIGLLGFVLLAGLLTAFAPVSPGSSPVGASPIIGAGCPDQAAIDSNKKDPDTCRYFNLGVNLFDTNIPQSAIDTYINRYGRGDINEFRKRVDYIVNSAKSVGLNPVLFLGYWKTESNFSTVGNRDLGCSPTAVNFYEQVDCALGVGAFSDPQKNPIANCARSKDPNSVACNALKDVRKTLDITNPIKYPIATFDDFAEAHGSRDPGLDGPGTTNHNCIITYNKLVEVAKELNACKATPATAVASCPVPGGRITYASYDEDPRRGHCTPGSAEYPCQAACPTIDRRAHSSDVDTSVTNGKVYLPKIDNEEVQWKFIQVVCAGGGVYPNCTNINGASGGLQVFEGTLPGSSDKWALQFVHMQTPHQLRVGQTYFSGTEVGSTDIGVVHITFGKNIKNPLGSGSVDTDCDPGWIPSDFMCK